ncbi:MAG TPA: hypothetical protein VGK09_10660 [Rhodocyclaceae bacterium]|jgi:hypothetical protein
MKRLPPPNELADQVKKMEEDFWLVRHHLLGEIFPTSTPLRHCIDSYDADLNEFAWVERVSREAVQLVFADGAERHLCPVCGHGMAPVRSAFDLEPEPKGYTQVGFGRHLTGFGNQTQCSVMRILQTATKYCIDYEKKYPSPFKKK